MRWHIATAIAGAALSSSLPLAPTTGARSTTQPPDLAAFVPPDAKVTVDRQVALLNGQVPQTVVEFVAQPRQYIYSTDLLVLAWDNFAKRWVKVFDAAKATVDNGPFVPQGMPTDATPSFGVIQPSPKERDLAIWYPVNYGTAAGTFENVGILHYDGTVADFAWTGSYVDGAAVKITGHRGHQDLRVGAPDVPVDAGPEYPVRSYTQVVGLAPFGPSAYRTIIDTRSFLGVYVDAAYRPRPGQYARIVSVVPGSPAYGLLHGGETIVSVTGAPTPPPMNTPEGDGELSVAELTIAQPGTQLTITVSALGGRRTVRVKLSSLASPAALSSPPQSSTGNYPLI